MPPEMMLQSAPRPTDSLPWAAQDGDQVEPAGLILRDAERRAAIRVLYVVKDNFWLDDVEESLLERLLETA
jgi:hypothetical protein